MAILFGILVLGITLLGIYVNILGLISLNKKLGISGLISGIVFPGVATIEGVSKLFGSSAIEVIKKFLRKK